MANRIQLRRDLASVWTSINPVLADGELGVEKDTLQFKLGDGVTAWTSLPYKGFDGTDGEPGPKGDTGSQGPAGSTGPAGSKGDTGDTGAQGIQGVPGQQGDPGATGPAGAKGDTGPKGDTGDAGSQGIQGVKGDTGDAGPKGDTGSQGPKGDTGDTGPQGSPGVKGDTGNTGAQGDPGTPGAKGDKGDTGSTGSQGIQGVKGDTGDTGPAGSDASVTKVNVEAVLTGEITSHTHAGGSSMLEVPWHADASAAFALTNSPLAERIVLAQPTRMCKLCPLTGFTQVRMVGVQSVTSTSANTPKVTLKYKTGNYSATLGDYADIGTSAVELSLTGTGAKDSGWVDLASGAKADVWVTLTEKGGDGALDPAFGHLTVYFK